MVWFTSDHHFNHENIIQHDSRPYSSLEEMTESLVSNWNSCVAKGDLVYYLGDFCMTWKKKDQSLVDGLLSRLNGTKHLIKGNHDRSEVEKASGWQWVGDYKYVTVENQKIVLFHYPIKSWRSAHHGSWHLHGHSHGNLQDDGGMLIDVGVKPNNYFPVSFDQVKDFMSHRTPRFYDHHFAPDR